MTASPGEDDSIPVVPADDPRASQPRRPYRLATSLSSSGCSLPTHGSRKPGLATRTPTGRCCMRQLTGQGTFPTVRLSCNVWSLLAPM